MTRDILTRTTLILGLAALAGCGSFGNAAQRAGGERELPFSADLDAEKGSRDFTVTVDPRPRRGVEIEGEITVNTLRESVRFEATKHCLLIHGGSQTRWQIDEVTGDWAFTQDGERLVFAGTCTVR